MSEYLNISVKGNHSGLRLIVYPQSSKAKVYEEREPLPGESRWQLVEGCTYAIKYQKRINSIKIEAATYNK